MTSQEQAPDAICGGPVDTVTGVCQWCGYRHKKFTFKQGQHESDIYQEKCNHPWPDRPRRSVNPRFRPMKPMEMQFRCWQCGLVSRLDSIRNPDLFAIVGQPDGVVYAHCNQCGAGLDIFQARILGANP